MLSIKLIKASAAQAANYYTSEEKNYYLKEAGFSEPKWLGVGANHVGLTGKAVNVEDLTKVLSGDLPGHSVSKNREHRPGWDLTLSSPKSFSIKSLVYGDTDLLPMHQAAVEKTLAILEKDTSQVRIADPETKKASFHNTGNMVIASIPHISSRDADPQIHSHNIVANLSFDETDKLRAMASCTRQDPDAINGMAERVYRDQLYYGMIYQSTLADMVQKAGYAIRPSGKGQFELSCVSEQDIKTFSKRREAIENAAKEIGSNSAKAMEVAALDTRKEKTFSSLDELRESWRAQASGKLLDTALPEFTPNDPKKAHEALDRAISHSAMYHTAIRYEKLMETAMRDFVIGHGLVFADLKMALDEKLQSGDLIGLDDKSSWLTSKELLGAEMSLVQATEKNFRDMKTVVNTNVLTQLGLSAKNESNIKRVFSSTKQINQVNIHGHSLPVIQALLHAGENSGKRVTILEPNQKTQTWLDDTSARRSHSVIQWLKNSMRGEFSNTWHRFIFQKEARNDLSPRDMVVVDQAHKLDIATTQSLIDLTQSGRAKVIFVNNDSLAGSFRGGNAMAALSKGEGGEFTWKSEKNVDAKISIHANKKDEERANELLGAFAALSQAERAQTHVITVRNVAKHQLTAGIRDVLKNEGSLSRLEKSIAISLPVYLSSAEQALAKHYKPGMQIDFVTPNGSNRVEVIAVKKNANQVHVVNEKGEQIVWEPKSSTRSHWQRIHQPTTLSVSKGEKLSVLEKTRHRDIKPGLDLTITDLGKNLIHFITDKGKTVYARYDEIANMALAYNYVTTPADLLKEREHALLFLKSYQADQALLNTVMQKTRTGISIYAESTEKVATRLTATRLRPSAIETVFGAAKVAGFERIINDKTPTEIRADITRACRHLSDKPTANIVNDAVTFALNKMNEVEAAFRHPDLVKEAIHYAFTQHHQPLSLESINAKLTSLKTGGQLLSEAYTDGVRWATPTAMATEARLLDRFTRSKGATSEFLSMNAAYDKLAPSSLTRSQKEAVHLLLTSRDRFLGIQGLAGTGKSTMLLQAITIMREAKDVLGEKINIVGLAPTHQAVIELKEKGVAADTLQSLLTGIRSGDVLPEKHKNTVFFLDESSMVGNKDLDTITDFIEKSGARGAIIGDVGQIGSPNAGRPFDLAMKRGVLAAAQLIDIVRQKGAPILKEATEKIADQDARGAFEKIKAQPIGEGQKPSIISTYEPITGDRKLDQLIASAKILNETAQDYLSRSPALRNNTLIIGYSNAERDDVTEQIREGLGGEKSLDLSKAVDVPRLRSLGVTRTEMGSILPYVPGLILTIGREGYFEVVEVDRQNRMVLLKDLLSGEAKPFFPNKQNNQLTHLWSMSTQSLAPGDQMMLRKHAQERGHIANETCKVSSIDPITKAVIVEGKSGVVHLDMKSLADCHWDYAYTRTANLAQGMTYSHVIAMVQSSAPLTDIKRAYIDISRATTHARIITDDEKRLVHTLENAYGLKASALDTIEKIPHQTVTYFDEKFPEGKSSSRSTTPLPRLDPTKITAAFISDPYRYCEILGDVARASKSELSWPSGISVLLEGENAGLITNKETGEIKTPTELLQGLHNIPAGMATEMAAKIIGGDITSLSCEPVSKGATARQSAQSIFDGTQPITNTLGEQYLTKTRGINQATVERSEARFWPVGATWERSDENGALSEKENKLPAVVIPAYDEKGELSGVQRIYLEKNSPEKNTFLDNAKFSTGEIRGSAGLIQTGTDDRVFIAEGPETALSIAQAKPDSTVLVAFSVNNIGSMAPVIATYDPSEVIIAADNDGKDKSSTAQVIQAADTLSEAGLNVTTIFPEPGAGREKTDYNDILKSDDATGLEKMIDRAIDESKKLEEAIVMKYLSMSDADKPDNLSSIKPTLDALQMAVKFHEIDPRLMIEVVEDMEKWRNIEEALHTVEAAITPADLTESGKGELPVDIELGYGR